MSKKAFLGVDVSAATLDFALLFASNPNSFVDFQIKNNSSGFLKLANWLNKQGVALDDCLIVMEYTGVYTLDFLVFLDSLGVQACSCSPIDIKRSIGLQRGKADKVDARRIASYALTQSYRLKPRALPEKALMELKEAVTMRRLYVKQKAALKNALHAHKKYHVYTGSDSHVTMLLQDIEHLNRRIKEIEKWIAVIIKKDEELNQNFKLIESVPGVGLIVAAMFLVYTNNFQYFDDARKFMCYAGVAPFPNESGTMKKQARVSHLANKKNEVQYHERCNIRHRAQPRNKSLLQ